MARSKARKTADLVGGNGIGRGSLAPDAVDGAKIADDSIDSEHYVDGSIDTAHIANNAVTAAKLAAGAAVPSQSGQSGKYLTTDGTNASWGTVDLSSKQDILSEGAFVDGDKTKLDGIEATADVTDTANVTAAGALMDSEVTNLAQVKAFDSSDYATAAQGALADSAVQNLGDLSITATAAEINKLDGVTASTTELNYVDGVTSNIQTQLNSKQASGSYLTGNQTITLSGDVSGSGTTSISVTVADDSHNHVISNVDGLQTALDAKLASSSYTASDVLTKIKTVDGSGSGLDADTVDGIQADKLLRSDVNDVMAGQLTLNGTANYISYNGSTGWLTLGAVSNDSGNSYIRESIIFSRNKGQITYSGGNWTNAGGSSTDWSMYSHISSGPQLHAGPSVSSQTSYTNTEFNDNFRVYKVDGSNQRLTFDENPYVDGNVIYHAGNLTPTAVSDQNNTSTGAFDLPSGTTAQRPSNPNTGYMRYNSTLGYVEQYTLNGWQVIAASPTISSVSPTSFSGESGTTITVNGSNFDGNAVVKFITSGGSTATASVTTTVSSSQLTATTPRDFTVAEEPLTVQVVNGTGLSATLDNAIDCGSVPAWSTSSGSLGTTIHAASYNFSVTATDDGSIASYAKVGGSLPTGASLNTSTGAITGTCPASTGESTYSFTIRATDNAGNTNDRTFSISTTPPKYRYWRIQINRSGGQIQTTEISLVHANGTWLGGGNGFTGAQSQNGASNAIYNGQANSSEHWNFASGSYIYFDFGSPGYSFGSGGVGKIRIGGSDDSGRYPNNIVVQRSDNNSSWTTVFNGSPPSFTHNGYKDKVIY